MPIQDDINFYFQHRAEFVKNFKNQFVLIHTQQLVNVFPTFEAALASAAAQYPPNSYLIKQVLDPEPTETIK